MKNFYITTPIYYANGAPHLGHAYTTIFCDILSRSKRLLGHEVFFSVGTDEHGKKIEKNAIKNGLTPQFFVDNMSEQFKKMWKMLDIDYDMFIRTTNQRHINNVKQFFSKMLSNNDIYLGEYEGWYCIDCESFWSDSQVGEKKICPDCLRTVKKIKEESYFFKCSRYVEKLLNFYNQNMDFCLPKVQLNEMINNFITPGLKDLSVSRTNDNWGIRVEENTKHTVYVWFDALFNYFSAVNFDNEVYKKFWLNNDTEIIHVVGKDIARFHCIYWPMFLMACDMRLPNRVLAHGLIKIKNEKMSKSKHNSIDPVLLTQYFGSDVIRYFLISEIPFGNNYDYSFERFIERINILPHQLGNLLNRVISMLLQYFDGAIPTFSSLNLEDAKMQDKMFSAIKDYKKNIDNLNITEATSTVFLFVADVNKYIDDIAPWKLYKNNKFKELESVMSHLAHFLYVIAMLLSPILVNKHKIILNQLGVLDKFRKLEFIDKFGILNNCVVVKGELLFKTIDDKDIDNLKTLLNIDD
ncbi:MAG: methionine--tRNA ligase [Bacilli bacterium]|nr:methionine--tRNA ligase [Bacilli bacterium]